MGFDVATKAPACFLQRFFRSKAGNYFIIGVRAKLGRDHVCFVTFAFAGLLGCFLTVRKFREDALPPVLSHEPLVDVAGTLLAVPHRVRHIGSSGDYVASGVKARTCNS